jgi:hypothetical protein
LSQENSPSGPENSSIIEEEPEGYEYSVDVKAWETFRNILRNYGVDLPLRNGRLTFRSERRIDMKGMKEMGLLWSYAVAKVKRVKELDEIG